MTMDIAKILELAADDITFNGLAKHALINESGQRCAIGAIAHAVGCKLDARTGGFVVGGDWDNEYIEEAAQCLAEHLPTLSNPLPAWDKVVYWNNAPDRTAADVVDAMRHAAKDLRNEATP